MLQRLLAGVCRDRWVPRNGWKVLTSKRQPRMNKGRGARSTGVHLSNGRFFVLPQRMPRIMMPDLTTTKLQPYVPWSKDLKPSPRGTGRGLAAQGALQAAGGESAAAATAAGSGAKEASS